MAESSSSSLEVNQTQNVKKNRRPNPNYVFRKRQPQKPEIGPNIVYVSTKTSIKGQLQHCSKLINNDHKEIIIYCLGASIQRGILLALQLCEKHVAFQHEVKTFTTTLIDDLEPAIDDIDYDMQKRFNSALKIRVFKTDLLESTNSLATGTSNKE